MIKFPKKLKNLYKKNKILILLVLIGFLWFDYINIKTWRFDDSFFGYKYAQNLSKGKGFTFNLYSNLSCLITFGHESISINKLQNGTKNINEFHKEVKTMQTNWKKYIKNDPFYNINLTLLKPDFSLNTNIQC